MKMPVIEGIIERRLLVNYRVAPDAIARLLPAPFRPKLVDGYAIAGICLIRLSCVRPLGLPASIGFRSENAAHRIAVEWDADGRTHEGVYVPRRDTDSCLNAFVGGRIFPGHHHRATFAVAESEDHFDVALRSSDDHTRVAVVGRTAPSLPAGSIFDDFQAASAFLRGGSLGYSPTGRPGCYDGLELRVAEWRVEPLAVESVASSFFDDPQSFPPGTVAFDCALVMRGVAHTWHSLPDLPSPAPNASAA